jgi:hypothetical protein
VKTTVKTAALAALGVLALAACGSSGGGKQAASTASTTPDPNRPSISVAGTGKVEGTPDTATVTIGVETRDPSAQSAMAKNNVEATALIAALKAKGVAAKDIQTSNLSVQPNWDFKGQRINGYTVSNTVTVKLHDIAHAGATIDAAAAKVGDDIRLQGVMFSIDNTSGLVAKARADAVKNALAQGRQLAAAAGVKLGTIRTISTNPQAPAPQYYAGGQASYALDRAAVPFEPGSQQLTVDVSVVFDIAS